MEESSGVFSAKVALMLACLLAVTSCTDAEDGWHMTYRISDNESIGQEKQDMVDWQDLQDGADEEDQDESVDDVDAKDDAKPFNMSIIVIKDTEHLRQIPGQTIGGIHRLADLLSDVLHETGGADLVVTPEFSLYEENCIFGQKRLGGACAEEYVVLEEKNGSYHVVTTGYYSQEIEKVRFLADEFNTTIVLGTFFEGVNVTSGGITEMVFFNSMAIIDSHGEIEGIRRKTSLQKIMNMPGSGEDCNQCFLQNTSRFCEGACDKLYTGTGSYEARTREGQRFSFIPLICHERTNEALMHRLEDARADLAVSSEYGASPQNELIMMQIQNRLPVDTTWYDHNETTFSGREVTIPTNGGVQIFAEKYRNRYRALASDAYFIAANGETGRSGIINIDQRRLREIRFGNRYTYAVVEIRR